MSRFTSPFLPAGILTGALLALAWACSGDDATGGDDDGDSGPPELRAALEGAFATSPGLLDGFDRLVVAVLGGSADGVTIVPTGNAVTVEIDVDGDGNDSRETTVTGAAVFTSPSHDIDEGAQVTFNGPAGTFVNASAFAQRTGPTTATFTDVSGGFGIPFGVIPPAQQVVATGGTVNLNLLTRNPSGSVDIEYLSSGDPIFATIDFESDGEGGWQMRVTAQDGSFEFLVP